MTVQTSRIRFTKGMVSVLTLAVMCIWASAVQGQQQPGEATNGQDELVHIAATTPNEDGVITIFRSDDKQSVSRYISTVVPLHYAPGMEVYAHVNKAVKMEGGTARPLKHKNPETGNIDYYIQVVTTERQMPSVIETIKAIDLPGMTSSKGDSRQGFRMKYRRASEMAKMLKETQLSDEGSVFADDVTNTLYLEDSISDAEGDLAFLEFYDVPAAQVDFDVQMIEIPESNASRLGVDWDTWKRSLSGNINIATTWAEGGNVNGALNGLLTLDAATLANFLGYTVSQGTATLVKRAKVTATNDQAAVISSVTRRVPIYASGDDKDKGGQGDEKIEVYIKPIIGTEMATAEIKVDAVTVSGLDEENAPIVNEQSLSTFATLEDDKALHIGTIERQFTSTYRRGIPGLRDIPILKYLFSIQGERTEKSKVFIIAKPSRANSIVYEAKIKGGLGVYAKPGDGSVLPVDAETNMLTID